MKEAHDDVLREWRLARSLRNRNYRLYLGGQSLSHVGLWLQETAELWVIFQLTGSGTALGRRSVMRFGPILFLGLYGGLLGDRLDRRRLMVVTQVCQGLGASVLAVAAWRGALSVTLSTFSFWYKVSLTH